MPQSQNEDEPISLPFQQYQAIVLWYPHNYSSGHALISSAPRIYHNPQRKSEIYIGAVTRDFQQCGILTSVDSEQPVQPPFRLRNLKWCSVSSLTLKGYWSDKQRL